MAISFEVPDEYPKIVLAIVVLFVQCIVISFALVVPARIKIFNNPFMKEKFAKEHAEHFPGQRAPFMGFPDAGSGRYSDSLPYKDWVSFNNVMRVHLNIVEQLPFLVPFMLIGGLIIPRIVMYLAWFGVFSRAAYVIGYVSKGANARLFGAAFNLFPNYAVAFFSLYYLSSNAIR